MRKAIEPHPPVLTRPHHLRREPKTGVVAHILEDGTIRPSGEVASVSESPARHGWSTGAISTDGWMLWWERRDTRST